MKHDGMRWEDQPVKVTFDQYDYHAEWSNPQQDVELEDIIRGFAGCMVATGWDIESVAEAMVRYGKEFEHNDPAED